MKIKNLGSINEVKISFKEVLDFKRSFPCSGIPSTWAAFQFDKNGLVDIYPKKLRNYDGSGLLALSEIAKEFLEQKGIN